MVTVLEQLKAEYEASAQIEWTIGSGLPNGRVLHVGPFYGYDYDALEMYREDPNAIWVVHAHNRMPLLLAVAEAAVRLIIRGGDPIFYVGDQSGKCLFCGRTALSAEPHMARRHEPDCMWLLARAAIAPLLEDVDQGKETS